jgi:uroporphyrinogen decarboxylase
VEKGPVIYNPVRSAEDVDRLQVRPAEETLAFTLEAIRLTRHELAGRGIPLIGFSGDAIHPCELCSGRWRKFSPC